MKINIKKGNLFNVSKDYYFVHCISSDCAMGAGIATQFQKKFKIKQTLLNMSESERNHPTCILTKNVFNMITKSKYWHKPTYDTFTESFRELLEIIADDNSITKLAMPKIGCAG